MADDETTRARVRRWVLDDFAIGLTAVDAVAAGLDDADVWRGTTADGTSYAVKWSSGGSDGGVLVPAALAAAGCRGVAGPLPTRSGALWSERDGRRLTVVPWVSGPSGLDAGLRRQDWIALGAVLAQAHALPMTGPPADALPREAYDPSRWTELCDAVDADLAAATDGDDLVDAVRSTWIGGRDRIHAVRDRVLDLGRRIRARPDRPADVVCHGDPHVGNVIIGPNGPVLLDWDDAVLAPPERDLMFVLGGVIWFAPVRTDERAGVAEGYGRPLEVDPELLAYVRCVRALEDVAEPASRVLAPGRWSRAERSEAASIVAGVLSPAGLVTLTLDGGPDGVTRARLSPPA